MKSPQPAPDRPFNNDNPELTDEQWANELAWLKYDGAQRDESMADFNLDDFRLPEAEMERVKAAWVKHDIESLSRPTHPYDFFRLGKHLACEGQDLDEAVLMAFELSARRNIKKKHVARCVYCLLDGYLRIRS
jgi:hypothetical protein